MLIFSPEPTTEDILDFMDEQERLDWNAGKGTPEERGAIWEDLVAIWKSIPDPTEEQLQPPYMHPTNWQACQESPARRRDIFNSCRRKWKKDRKAAALEAQRSGVMFSPSSNKPEWVDTADAIHLSLDGEAMAEPSPGAPETNDTPTEVGTQLHPITPRVREEIEKQGKWGVDWPRKTESPPKSKGMELSELNKLYEDEHNPDASKGFDLTSIDRNVSDLTEKLRELAKPPELPDFKMPDIAPPPRLSLPEIGRWEDLVPGKADMEEAFDNALKKAEDRARAQLGLEEFTRAAGFSPMGDVSRPQKQGHREYFWNGTAVVVAILTLIFWTVLFVVAWGFYMAWIFRAPWFEKQSKDQRLVFKGIIATGLSVLFLVAWLYLPKPLSLFR